MAYNLTPYALPARRSEPLLRGGSKEAMVRRFAGEKLAHVAARHERRFSQRAARAAAAAGLDDWVAPPESEGEGYDRFDEVVKDLQELLDVLWVSNTPDLQIPFLLNLSQVVADYLPAYTFSPGPTFQLLDALDTAWEALLDPDPGMRALTLTDKVRLRGIAERTRLVVAREAVAGEAETEEGDSTDSGEDGDDVENVDDGDEFVDVDMEMDGKDTSEQRRRAEGHSPADDDGMRGLSNQDPATVEMGVAKVYYRTIVALGREIDGAEQIGWSNC